MYLLPITLQEDKSKDVYASPECQGLLKVYEDYYRKVGFHPPWIGYFVVRDEHIVGCCGFVEQPRDGQVEIAYGTFKDFEGQGIASFSCQQLISLARQTDTSLTITAKTAPQPDASNYILQRNGFVYSGIVQDHEIGDAWLWVLEPR